MTSRSPQLRITAATTVRGRGVVIFARVERPGALLPGALLHVTLVDGGQRDVVIRTVDVEPRVNDSDRARGPLIAMLVEGVLAEEVALDTLLALD